MAKKTTTSKTLDSDVARELEEALDLDFAQADSIRNALAGQGIALMDYKDEQGQRQTKWEVKR